MHLPRVNASRINTAFESLFEPQKKNSPTLARHRHAQWHHRKPKKHFKTLYGNPRNFRDNQLVRVCALYLFRYDKDPNFRIITRKTQQEITRNSEIGWNSSKTRRNQYTRIQVRVLILGYRGHPIQTLIIRRSLGVPVVVSRRQRTESDPETQNFPFRKPKTFPFGNPKLSKTFSHNHAQ